MYLSGFIFKSSQFSPTVEKEAFIASVTANAMQPQASGETAGLPTVFKEMKAISTSYIDSLPPDLKFLATTKDSVPSSARVDQIGLDTLKRQIAFLAANGLKLGNKARGQVDQIRKSAELLAEYGITDLNQIKPYNLPQNRTVFLDTKTGTLIPSPYGNSNRGEGRTEFYLQELGGKVAPVTQWHDTSDKAEIISALAAVATIAAAALFLPADFSAWTLTDVMSVTPTPSVSSGATAGAISSAAPAITNAVGTTGFMTSVESFFAPVAGVLPEVSGATAASAATAAATGISSLLTGETATKIAGGIISAAAASQISKTMADTAKQKAEIAKSSAAFAPNIQSGLVDSQYPYDYGGFSNQIVPGIDNTNLALLAIGGLALIAFASKPKRGKK